MSRFIDISAGAAAPQHVLNTSIQTWISPQAPRGARSSTITSRVVANKIVVDRRLINDGNNCVRAVDEETGAFRDVMRGAKLAAFDGIGALDQVWVDPIGLLWEDPVYTSLFQVNGEIYDLGHGVVVMPGGWFLGLVFFTGPDLRPSGRIACSEKLLRTAQCKRFR